MNNKIITKIGCYSNSSDFGFGGMWGLLGFHWKKNYVYHSIEITPPSDKTLVTFYKCPTCNRNIKIKIPSIRVGKRNRLLNGIVGILIITLIIIIITFNFRNYNLDSDKIGVIKVQSTIWGSLLSIQFLRNSYSNWICFYPKICKDIRFSFFKHKFFHTSDS